MACGWVGDEVVDVDEDEVAEGDDGHDRLSTVMHRRTRTDPGRQKNTHTHTHTHTHARARARAHLPTFNDNFKQQSSDSSNNSNNTLPLQP